MFLYERKILSSGNYGQESDAKSKNTFGDRMP